jgi:hypothetical protein
MHICKLSLRNPIVKDLASLPMKSLVGTKIHVTARRSGQPMATPVDGGIDGNAAARPGSDSLVLLRRADLFTDG